MKLEITKIVDVHKSQLNNNIWIVLNPSLLAMFTRVELRQIAEELNIPKGRNKSDTIINILRNRDKIKLEFFKFEIKIKVNEKPIRDPNLTHHLNFY